MSKLTPSDESFEQILDQIRVVNNDSINNKGCSIWEIQKKVSNMCKGHNSDLNPNTSLGKKIKWPKKQRKKYDAYKEKDKVIAEARKAGRAATKEAPTARRKALIWWFRE